MGLSPTLSPRVEAENRLHAFSAVLTLLVSQQPCKGGEAETGPEMLQELHGTAGMLNPDLLDKSSILTIPDGGHGTYAVLY